MSKLKKYLITIGIGLLIAGFVAYSKDLFSQTELSKILHILTDSFFVPAVLITSMGSLMFVSREGAFDGLTFAVTSFIDVFRKQKKNQYTTYYDYKQSKGNRDYEFVFMLVSGLIFLVISGIIYLLYRQYV